VVLLVGLLGLGSPACATFGYRSVQSDFEAAVLADNQELDPIIDRSGQLYAEVVGALSAERIASLEPRLRANAWLLRAFSQWRLGAFADARASAARGRNAGPALHSRDDVLLHLIPALAIDSEAMQAFVAAGRRVEPARYQARFAPDFATALEQVGAAEARFGAATPHSTRFYVLYQRWRLVANWREVVSRLPDAEARRQARAHARVDGLSLADAANAAREAIPESYFLRQRMR